MIAASLLLTTVPVQAGFFDEVIDSVKKATEDTIERVTADPETDAGGEVSGNTTAGAAPSAGLAQPSKKAYTPESDRALVRDIQQRLNELGYAAGAPDGLYGPGTRGAIRSYQKQNGLPVDGRPSRTLLTHLVASTKAGQQGAINSDLVSASPVADTSLNKAGKAEPTVATATALALARLQFDASWFDDEQRLRQLTTRQIMREKAEQGGLYGQPAFFDQAKIVDREPQFAARELAPVMRERLLELAAGVGPRFVRRVPWRRFSYDFDAGTLKFQGLLLREAPAKLRSTLPANVKDLALYEIPRSAGSETQFGLAADIESAARLLAFDRVLELDAVPVPAAVAEKIVALDDPVVRLEFRVTDAVDDVLLAEVEKLEVTTQAKGAPLLTLGPDRFPAAIASNAPTSGSVPTVTRTMEQILVSPLEPDMADLLLVRYFPERLDDEYLLTLLKERQRFEASQDSPPWGRFFQPGARAVDDSDLARYGAAFREWTLARAKKLRGQVAIRVERQHVEYDPNANRASLSFNSGSSCLQQRNVSSLGAELGIAVKSTRDQCGARRHTWSRQPELVVALDRMPMPPLPSDAAKLSYGYVPMEIVFEVTDKRKATAPGEGDMLLGKLTEVRYFDQDNQLIARVVPKAPTPVAQRDDPLLRANSAKSYGPEIAGVQLGMPIEVVDQKIRAHAKVKDRFVGKAPFPFDGAYAYVLGEGEEYFALYTIRDSQGERLAALERQVFYLPSTAPPDKAVAGSLTDKYGEPTSRRDYDGFEMRWSHEATGETLTRKAAKARGCQGLVDSPQAMDVFRKTDGNPYVWALPGVDRVWMGPGNGFGLKRDGRTAADMAGCGTELSVSWSHNNGQAHGPSLWIKLYDAPWMHAYAETRKSKNAGKIAL